jgi:hypothetical protein
MIIIIIIIKNKGTSFFAPVTISFPDTHAKIGHCSRGLWFILFVLFVFGLITIADVDFLPLLYSAISLAYSFLDDVLYISV